MKYLPVHSMDKSVQCAPCGCGCLLPGKLEESKLTMDEFWHALSFWSQKTFGNDHDFGPFRPLSHLKKEVDEVLADPYDIIEYADCIFLVFDACRRAGFRFEDLRQAVNDKFKINLARKWAPQTSDQPTEHVRDS